MNCSHMNENVNRFERAIQQLLKEYIDDSLANHSHHIIGMEIL